jgi:hypothetical protein
MPRLHIYVSEKGGKTVSKFGKPKDNDKVVFHNQHDSATLSVKILGDAVANKALCQGSMSFPEFTVDPKAKKAFEICQGYGGQEFEYTAQIGAFALEDPIIIIERSGGSGFLPPNVSHVLIPVAAFLLGAFLAARWVKSRSAPRT